MAGRMANGLIAGALLMSAAPFAVSRAQDDNQSLQTCAGNYVPPGQRGHGAVVYAESAVIGWTVVDYVADGETGCVRVLCRKGAAPRVGIEDVDFFEFGGVMYKLISGDVKVGADDFSVTPERAVRMKVFSTASAFPVEKTPLLYRFNHWREDKAHHRKTLPPLDYLRYLKETNASCTGLPLPE